MILNGDSIWMPAYSWLVRAFGVTALCLAALSGLGGCSASDAVGNLTLYPVKGKVLLADGKPLTAGRIMFVNPNNGVHIAPLEADGSYTTTLPEGTYSVAIDLPNLGKEKK